MFKELLVKVMMRLKKGLLKSIFLSQKSTENVLHVILNN